MWEEYNMCRASFHVDYNCKEFAQHSDFLSPGGARLVAFQSPFLCKFKRELMEMDAHSSEHDLQNWIENQAEELGRDILLSLAEIVKDPALNLDNYAINGPMIARGYPVGPHSDCNWNNLNDPRGFQILWIVKSPGTTSGSIAFASNNMIETYSSRPVYFSPVSGTSLFCVIAQASGRLVGVHPLESASFRYVRVDSGTAVVFNKTCIHFPIATEEERTNKTRLALALRFVPRKNFCVDPDSFPDLLKSSLHLGSDVWTPTRLDFNISDHCISIENQNVSVFGDHSLSDLEVTLSKQPPK